jgi:hypothetical protein
MGTISQPVGGHNPAAEQKLYKVSHEEKTSVVVRLERLRVWGLGSGVLFQNTSQLILDLCLLATGVWGLALKYKSINSGFIISSNCRDLNK